MQQEDIPIGSYLHKNNYGDPFCGVTWCQSEGVSENLGHSPDDLDADGTNLQAEEKQALCMFGACMSMKNDYSEWVASRENEVE